MSKQNFEKFMKPTPIIKTVTVKGVKCLVEIKQVKGDNGKIKFVNSYLNEEESNKERKLIKKRRISEQKLFKEHSKSSNSSNLNFILNIDEKDKPLSQEDFINEFRRELLIDLKSKYLRSLNKKEFNYILSITHEQFIKIRTNLDRNGRKKIHQLINIHPNKFSNSLKSALTSRQTKSLESYL